MNLPPAAAPLPGNAALPDATPSAFGPDDAAAVALAVQSLDRWAAAVTPAQQARLLAARRAALAASRPPQSHRAPAWQRPLLGAALAGAAALAVTLAVLPGRPATPPASAVATAARPAAEGNVDADAERFESVVGLGETASEEDELLDADLDFALAFSGLDEAT